VLGVELAGVQHDLDVGVVLLVLGLEVVEAEVAPEVDLEGDRAGAGFVAAAAALQVLATATADHQ
jgi:hypothetical protein